MSATVRLPAARTVRVTRPRPAGTPANFVVGMSGQARLLRRIAVFANHDTRVLS